MRPLTVAVGLSIGLLAPAATGLQGQTVPGEGTEAFCWRGKALPACRSFALFELESALAVASTTGTIEGTNSSSEYPVFQDEVKWHLGAMRNVSDYWALGAALSVGIGSPTPLTGVRVRARHWVKPWLSAEIEAGAVDTGDRFGSGFEWGPTYGARLNMGDYFSVFTRWEGAYAEPGSDAFLETDNGFHQGVYVGASAGSTVAVAGTAALGVVGLVGALVVRSILY